MIARHAMMMAAKRRRGNQQALLLWWLIVSVVLNEARCNQQRAGVVTEHEKMAEAWGRMKPKATIATNVISDASSNLNKNSLIQNENMNALKDEQQQQQQQQITKTDTTASMTMDFESIELQQSSFGGTARQQLLRHRQKRYLLFPEGSSFQLVFDLIIPIVDYTNYAIMGITCAIAWELPSKPPSEIIEHVRTRLHDGTLGVVRRNDTQEALKYVDSNEPTMTYVPDAYYRQPHQPTTAPMPQAQHKYYYPGQTEAQAQAKPSSNWNAGELNQQTKPLYYNGAESTSGYANVPTQQLQQQQQQQKQQQQQWQQSYEPNWYTQQSPTSSVGNYMDAYYRQPTAAPKFPDGDNNWWQRNKARIKQNWHDRQQKWNKYETPRQPQYSNRAYAYKPPASAAMPTPTAYARNGRQRKLLQQPPKHRIHTVFLRRRRRRRQGPDLDHDSTVFERIHLREHLTSRELLFHKIEKLYKTRSLNGTACVLRALCESGQRNHNDEPQSFIMELVGAIFQLPKDEATHELIEGHVSRHYRAAYETQGDCKTLFRECAQSFWQQ